MNRQSALLERLLIELAAHIDSRSATVRLVYDDHHAGDRLALITRSPEGLCELQLWREQNSKLHPRVHVLADSPAAAAAFATWTEQWAAPMPWRARSSKRFAARVAGLANELSASFTARATGYPQQARARLEHGLMSARPMVGVTGPLVGNQDEPLAVVAGGMNSSLWAAAVPLEVGEGHGPRPERALIWDPNTKGFLAPRELRAELSHRQPLPELASQWQAWCLAPPPPQMIEQALTPVDFRAQSKRSSEGSPSGDDCFDCLVYAPCSCDVIDCAMLDFGGLDCSLLECGGLDCIPCDF